MDGSAIVLQAIFGLTATASNRLRAKMATCSCWSSARLWVSFMVSSGWAFVLQNVLQNMEPPPLVGNLPVPSGTARLNRAHFRLPPAKSSPPIGPQSGKATPDQPNILQSTCLAGLRPCLVRSWKMYTAKQPLNRGVLQGGLLPRCLIFLLFLP